MNKILYFSIKKTFENEIKKLIKDITREYGEAYLFTEKDLLDYYKTIKIRFRYTESEEVKDDDHKYKLPDDKDRCYARTWSDGFYDKKNKIYGGRCKKSKFKDTDYCIKHNHSLVHGRFDLEPNAIVKGFFLKHNDPSLFRH